MLTQCSHFCFAIMSFSSTFPLNGDLLVFSWIIQCQFSGCCHFTQPTYTHSRACCEKLHYSHPTHPHLQVAKTRLIQRKERMGKWLGWTKNKTSEGKEWVHQPLQCMWLRDQRSSRLSLAILWRVCSPVHRLHLDSSPLRWAGAHPACSSCSCWQMAPAVNRGLNGRPNCTERHPHQRLPL